MKYLLNLAALVAVILLASFSKPANDELNIPFQTFTLDNGLTVIMHQDKSDPIASVAVYYHVGSNREVKGRTGFAHLFEHMMFQQSENVPEDQYFKLIQSAGGTLNGSTNQDRTNYYQTVPKNALEMVLWMESDRMGYLTNTLTPKAFAIQQNVVQNEKRQTSDNRPYGHSFWVMSKTMYPEGHPYSWTVIGEMEDLFNATVEDAKEFHSRFYVPNNATVAITGDIDFAETLALVKKYFGEIPKGPEVPKLNPIPVKLAQTKKVYHEDNFANAPQFTMAFPSSERYSRDAYALSALANLVAGSKGSPMYKVLVEEKKLTPNVGAYNSAQELAGTFQITVTANPNVSLAEVEKAIMEGFARFEKEGFTARDLERIKASDETSFYNRIGSIAGKAFTLAEYDIFAGDAGFYKTDLQNRKDVTAAQVMEVYESYIKGKPYVAMSFVPKGKVDLVAEGSVNAGVVEEDILKATQVAIEDDEANVISKTPASFDRSVQPPFGAAASLTIPPVWKSELKNGVQLYGITHNEVPLVQYNLVIDGGHLFDEASKPGVANLLAMMLNEGTATKTPSELENAIDMLGARIRVMADEDNISVMVNTLSRNFDATLALVEEMLLQPRWDANALELAKTRVAHMIKRNATNPSYLASSAMSGLVFGKDHILATDVTGTLESVAAITMDDLKAYYSRYISPSVARINVVGSIDKADVLKGLASLNRNWKAKPVTLPSFTFPAGPEASKVYFVDVPGATQSNIYIGNLSIPRTHVDYFPAYVANYKLGGSFNSYVNLVLREEKGFTYGARTNLSAGKNYGLFNASSAVRSTATLESAEIFRDLMRKYRQGATQEDVDFTKDALVKSNALRFETQSALLGMLNTMSAYNLPANYIEKEEMYVTNLTPADVDKMVKKYIDPDKMYYVIVGDAKTQLDEMKKLGFGDPILVK